MSDIDDTANAVSTVVNDMLNDDGTNVSEVMQGIMMVLSMHAACVTISREQYLAAVASCYDQAVLNVATEVSGDTH